MYLRDINEEQKILFIEEMRGHQIWLRPKKYLKISFKLYHQFLLKDFMKVGLNWLHFAWTKVSQMQPRVN